MSNNTEEYSRIKPILAITLIIAGLGYFGYYLLYRADARFEETVAIGLFAIIIGGIGAAYKMFDLRGRR